MKLKLILCSLLACLPLLDLSGRDWIKSYALDAYVGPEIYYAARTKEGGAKQSGTLYGVRLGGDYIRRNKIYLGLDMLWAQGCLRGKAQDSDIKSILTDTNTEGRVGFTLQTKNYRCVSFTPYTGFGYFWENNCFEDPTPLPIHFKNQFAYIPFGFLSQFFINSNLSLGLNFKVRYLVNGKVKASNDPDHDDSTQNYDEKLQYRVELPADYFFCFQRHSLALSVVPFYEYRPYGHRANFPFDFLETKFNLYGATLKFLYLF